MKKTERTPSGESSKEKQAKRAGINFEHNTDLIDAGMYCCGELHGVGINALVDIGATATMISDIVYQK